jgi:hypothetical protein
MAQGSCPRLRPPCPRCSRPRPGRRALRLQQVSQWLGLQTLTPVLMCPTAYPILSAGPTPCDRGLGLFLGNMLPLGRAGASFTIRSSTPHPWYGGPALLLTSFAVGAYAAIRASAFC